jgi:lipocalin
MVRNWTFQCSIWKKSKMCHCQIQRNQRYSYQCWKQRLQHVNSKHFQIFNQQKSFPKSYFIISVNQDNNSTIGYAYVPNPAEAPNKLLVKFPMNPIPGQYNVWTTDYDSYALVYSCTPIIKGLLKLEMIWILARQNTLDEQVVSQLKGLLLQQNVNIERFERTSHSNCNY